MAHVAAAGSVEIFPAFFAIAGNDVEDAISIAIDGSLLAAAQESGDVLDLIGRKMERGHAFAGAALLDHRADFVAVLVIQRKFRANQIRAGIAALRGCAMAKAAVADEDFLPTLYRWRIGDRAADQHVAAAAWSGGGRGLGD